MGPSISPDHAIFWARCGRQFRSGRNNPDNGGAGTMAERDWQNSGNQTQQSLTGDSGHPFLTQRGLWLQQNSRVDLPQGIALPSNFPGGSGAGGSSDIPVSGSWIKTETDPNSKEPPLLGRFRDEPLNEGSLQNLQPAEHFPDVASLRRGPLTQHYASALASDRIWDDRSTLPLSPSITPKELNQANRAFAHAARAIGKMVIRLAGKPASQFASGSAFVTGPNTIMTCAHNLFDSNERQCRRAGILSQLRLLLERATTGLPHRFGDHSPRLPR